MDYGLQFVKLKPFLKAPLKSWQVVVTNWNVFSFADFEGRILKTDLWEQILN